MIWTSPLQSNPNTTTWWWRPRGVERAASSSKPKSLTQCSPRTKRESNGMSTGKSSGTSTHPWEHLIIDQSVFVTITTKPLLIFHRLEEFLVPELQATEEEKSKLESGLTNGDEPMDQDLSVLPTKCISSVESLEVRSVILYICVVLWLMLLWAATRADQQYSAVVVLDGMTIKLSATIKKKKKNVTLLHKSHVLLRNRVRPGIKRPDKSAALKTVQPVVPLLQSQGDVHRLRGPLRWRLHQKDYKSDEAQAAGDRSRAARSKPRPGRVLQGLQQGHQGLYTQNAGDCGRHQWNAHLPGQPQWSSCAMTCKCIYWVQGRSRLLFSSCL